MKRSLAFAIALFAAGAALAAEPSLHEVYQAVAGGHLKQAQTMMDQVLRDHPGSGKAHYVEAELLAKEGLADKAQAELATAERLAPGLPFAKPEAVAQLKRLIEPAPPLRAMPAGAHAPVLAAASHESSWSPLLIGLALIAIVMFVISTMTRARARTGTAAYLPAGGNNFGSGYPQPVGAGGVGPLAPAGGGVGSGILGGLATGAAVGAGMVAGEALMHRVFDGGSHAADARHVDSLADYPIVPEADYDAGGNDFGVSDGASWDDNAGAADDWN